MPHPGLTQYIKINTKYFDQGVTTPLSKQAEPPSKCHYEDQGTLQTGQGQSCGEVQIRVGLQKISETLNIPRSTIKSVIKKWKEHGTTTNLPREGRAPKHTDQARRALIREATKRPKLTLKELQSSTAEIGVSVHRTTLSRTIHRDGKKPLLKEKISKHQKACGRLPEHMEEGTLVR
jgi:transposase